MLHKFFTDLFVRQCLLVQLTLIQPESEGAEDDSIFIVQSDCLLLCLGEAIVESSLEVGG
jgi:hypothetical protein